MGSTRSAVAMSLAQARLAVALLALLTGVARADTCCYTSPCGGSDCEDPRDYCSESASTCHSCQGTFCTASSDEKELSEKKKAEEEKAEREEIAKRAAEKKVEEEKQAAEKKKAEEEKKQAAEKKKAEEEKKQA